jgi:hypothetical protein
VPFFVAFGNMIGSTYLNLQAIRIDKTKSLEKLSFHEAEAVELIKELEQDAEHTGFVLTNNISKVLA